MGSVYARSVRQTFSPHVNYRDTFQPFPLACRAWSLAAGYLPQISRDGILISESSIFERDELRDWIPYAGDQIPQGLDLRQPSHVRGVYKSLCKLSTLIHSTLCIVHSDADSVSSRDVVDIYTRMLDWYSSLPEVLRLGDNSTPSVLFVQ